MHRDKMKLSNKLQYGAASLADAAPYSFTSVYLIFFLTAIVGLSPEKAGNIGFIAILFNGFFAPFVGYVSDHTRGKWGRRRPYLLLSILPLCAGLILLFTPVDIASFSGAPQYYIFSAVLFWAGFSIYYTPYTAIGAEITGDYDERSSLRSYARGFAILGNCLGTVAPFLLIDYLAQRGITAPEGWHAMAIAIAVFSGLSILITWRGTRGKELAAAVEKRKGDFMDLCRSYVRILRLKPFKYLMVATFCFMFAGTLYNSALIFFMKYNLGVSEEVISGIFMVSIIASIFYTPLIGHLSVKLDKKLVLGICMLLTGTGGLLFKIVGISGYPQLIFYICIFTIGHTCYWQLSGSLLYDLSEVSELLHGRREEGSIISVNGILNSIGTAIPLQLTGRFLKSSGYDPGAAAQSQSAMTAIENLFLLLPGMAFLVAGAVLLLYPVNRRRFLRLKDALALKKEGKEYSREGLRRIL